MVIIKMVKDLMGVPIHGDCMDVLALLPDSSIDLSIIDYPWSFSLNKWDLDLDTSIQLIQDTIPELYRCGKVGSSIYAMSASYDCNVTVKESLEYAGYEILNWIVWRRDLGYHPKTKWKTRGIHIFYARKGDSHTFNADSVRIPQRRKTVDPQANPKGMIPSDVWVDVPELRRNARAYLGHKGQKPELLYDRMILASSNPGDLLLDICAGTFTLAASASRLGRDWICCDTSKEWVEVACDRLSLPEYLVIG